MVKIKLEKLYWGQKSYAKFFNLDFPIKTAFRLKKTSIQLKKELRILEEFRINLVKKYGVLVPGVQEIYVIPNQDNFKKYNWTLEQALCSNQKFQEDFKEILNQEIEIDIEMKKLTLKDLEGQQLSASDLLVLEDFIDG